MTRPKGSLNKTKKGNLITIDKDDPTLAIIHILSPKFGEFKVTIDTKNIYKVKDLTWSIACSSGSNYAVTHIFKNGKQKRFHLHNLIMKQQKGMDTDHINGDTLLNTEDNLRICSHEENSRNRKPHKNSSSRFKGVCFVQERQKWKATIRVKGSQLHLGYFMQEEDAARAYNEAAETYYKNFARINKIGG